MTHNGILTYRVIAEDRYDPAIGQYHTYGIQATPQIRIHDVSPDREVVEAMAKLFTEHQLDPIHLKDGVEDLLL